MPRIIHIPANTKLAHGKFIAWLNELLNNYVSSYYDDAIKNIIEMSFIKKHNSFLLELYQGDGSQLSGFMTILPSDTTNFMIMVHDVGDGKPFLYNKVDGANLFEFTHDGTLSRFYENVTVQLTDEAGNNTHECFIVFEDWYGIKAPLFKIKEIGTNSLVGTGLLDLNFQGRYSGSYVVENKPMNEVSYFEVVNTTKMIMTIDVPILTDLNIRYILKPDLIVRVPVTEWSEFYFKQAKLLGGVTVKKVIQ